MWRGGDYQLYSFFLFFFYYMILFKSGFFIGIILPARDLGSNMKMHQVFYIPPMAGWRGEAAYLSP